MKKYRLKQDYRTPHLILNSGDVIREYPSYYFPDETSPFRPVVGIDKNLVENNPDWFEEVKEEPKSDVYEDAAKEIQMMSLFSDQVIANTLREKYIILPREKYSFMSYGTRLNYYQI